MTHSDVGVNLFLKASNQGKVLPDCLLEVRDAAALLLRVTRNFQLETHTLLFLTVFLHVQKIKKNKHRMSKDETSLRTWRCFVNLDPCPSDAPAYLASGLHV